MENEEIMNEMETVETDELVPYYDEETESEGESGLANVAVGVGIGVLSTLIVGKLIIPGAKKAGAFISEKWKNRKAKKAEKKVVAEAEVVDEDEED